MMEMILKVYGFGIDGNTIREYNDLPQNRSWTCGERMMKL